MDYVAMQLSSVKLPVIHPTDAASFGLYDIKNNRFDEEAIKKLGLSYLTLPFVAKNDENTGSYNGIPVGSAIGDNQASFFGSVKNNDNTMLLNFGTGSQISVIIDNLKEVDNSLEIRPYMFGKYLLCGSALCGGRAYSILEKFFHSYADNITENVANQYEVMNKLALKAYENKQKLNVCTKFCGMRSQPDVRGSITGIGEDNFTPENLVLGVLDGMALELYEYYLLMKVDNVSNVVASGNEVQKNKVLVNLLRDNFNMDVALTGNSEEASIGAALFTALKNKIIDENQISEIIVYK
jgi:sedoheptulokinase